MHNVLMGVFKTLLKFWTEKSNKPHSLTEAQRMEIDKRQHTLKKQISSDFARTPRPLLDLKWFKATELRLLLLYTGPFVFLNVVKQRYYNHFIKLHTAIRILCHPLSHRTENHTAKNLLESFAEEFKMLYGEEYFVYNFHVLTHLAKDCLLHGCLDAFSAFPFENYLQMMLRCLKKAPFPLHQFKNRLGEQLLYGSKDKTPTIRQRGDTFLVITTNKGSIISVGSNDSYVHKDGKVYQVIRIKKDVNSFILDCRAVLDLIALYMEPFNSNDIGVYCCEQIILDESRVEHLNADEAVKVLRITLDGIVGLIAITHTDS